MKEQIEADTLRETILSDLVSVPSSQEFCLQVFEYLLSHKYDDVRHLTKTSLYSIAHKTPSDDLVLESLRYLIGDRANILETCFEFIDEDEEAYVLDKCEINELRRTGVFVHPISGMPIPEPESKIFMFFSPSTKMKKLQKG